MNHLLKNTIKAVIKTASITTIIISTQASAHDLNMWPSQFNIHSEKPTVVTVDLSFSETAYRLDHAASLNGFSVLDANGKKLRNTGNLYKSAQRTTVDLPIDGEGTYTVLYQSSPRYTTSYSMSKEDKSSNKKVKRKEKGMDKAEDKSKNKRLRLDKIAAQSELPKGAKNVVTKKSITRGITFITNTVPSETPYKATGVGLEITPITHPSDYVTNDTLAMKVTYNGKALKNTSVYLKRDGAQYTNDSTPQKVETNQQGELDLTLILGGRYMLSIKHSVKEKSPLYDEVNYRLFYAFEVNYE